jgi:cysteine desulfurase
MQVYLDNAATTKLDKRVLKKMEPYYFTRYGNASSIHFMGQENDLEIAACKEKIGKILGADPRGLIFTSCATEANNMIIKGVMRANMDKGKHLIISAFEHLCVLNSALELKSEGFEVDYAPVDNEGLIRLDELEKLIRPDTVLVSIMTVNNEIGVIQDLEAIVKLVHKNGAYFHTDAVQAIPHLKFNISQCGFDFFTISAHKFHGPQGVGLAYANPKIRMKPLIVGGGQEDNRRSGTYNMAGIVGLTEALILAYKERTKELAKIKSLRDYFWKRLQKEIPEVSLNGSWKKRVSGNLNVMFDRIEGEAVLIDLSLRGVCVSTGSACSAQNLKTSSVIRALGIEEKYLNSNIRFSFGKYNTKREADYALNCLKKTVARLRKFSPIC